MHALRIILLGTQQTLSALHANLSNMHKWDLCIVDLLHKLTCTTGWIQNTSQLINVQRPKNALSCTNKAWCSESPGSDMQHVAFMMAPLPAITKTCSVRIYVQWDMQVLRSCSAATTRHPGAKRHITQQNKNYNKICSPMRHSVSAKHPQYNNMSTERATRNTMHPARVSHATQLQHTLEAQPSSTPCLIKFATATHADTCNTAAEAGVVGVQILACISLEVPIWNASKTRVL